MLIPSEDPKKKWRKKTIPAVRFVPGGGGGGEFEIPPCFFFLSWPHFVQGFFKVTERDIVDV